MKTAQDYPITFLYGATDGIYYYTPSASKPKTDNWIANYHRGSDRAMPDGTPVLVNGVQIGLSGHTGAASGPHLHIGRFVGGVDTPPQGGGLVFDDSTEAKVTEINEDPVNGKYVRVQADGASWVYLHLSQQTATVGEVLKQGGETMPNKTYTLDAQSLRILHAYVGGWDIDKCLNGDYDKVFMDAQGWKDANQAIYDIFIGSGTYRDKVKALLAGLPVAATPEVQDALKVIEGALGL